MATAQRDRPHYVVIKSSEMVSKPHLASDSCVADLFKMLTYSQCMLEQRFFIGLRLAFERDLRF